MKLNQTLVDDIIDGFKARLPSVYHSHIDDSFDRIKLRVSEKISYPSFYNFHLMAHVLIETSKYAPGIEFVIGETEDCYELCYCSDSHHQYITISVYADREVLITLKMYDEPVWMYHCHCKHTKSAIARLLSKINELNNR